MVAARSVTPRPKEFNGEGHLAVVKREPAGSPRAHWCEFEERAGPAPADGTGHDSGAISGACRGSPGQSESPPPDPETQA